MRRCRATIWRGGSGPLLAAQRTLAALFTHPPALDRSGAHDPDARRRLCLCHSLGTRALPRGSAQPAYRWFCGLGIEDKVPDHSAFTRARNERFREHDIFRQVFERVVAACIKAQLVGGVGFAVDASLIVTDANKCGSTPGDECSHDIDPATVERAVQDYLANLDNPAWGAATDVVPNFVALADPAAQWTGALRNAAFFAYRTTISSTLSLTSSWTSKPRAPFAKQKSALRRQ